MKGLTPQARKTLQSLESKLGTSALLGRNHLRTLRKNTKLLRPLLEKLKKVRTLDALVLPDQPFDRVFLALSPLYRKSREGFLSMGGCFEPKLTTSPRSLSSLILTEPRIEYTPHETELLWRLDQPPTPAGDAELLKLITYSTSLFHEQSHRLLWPRVAPLHPLSRDSLRQYLNFMESLVVMLDMALGDELGPGFSSVGYLSGTLYDPGTPISFADPRARRNYLQAALQATYLALEGYAKLEIRRVMLARQETSGLTGEALKHAIDRALRLDDLFITRTNPLWQRKWTPTLLRLWGKKPMTRTSAKKWGPPQDPLQWTSEYLLAEHVMDEWGIE